MMGKVDPSKRPLVVVAYAAWAIFGESAMSTAEYCDAIAAKWRQVASALQRVGGNLGTDEEMMGNLHYVRDQMRRIEADACVAADLADELLLELHNARVTELANVR